MKRMYRSDLPTQTMVRADFDREYLHMILMAVGHRRHMEVSENRVLNLFIAKDRKWTMTLPIENDYPVLRVMRTGVTRAKASVTSNAYDRLAITCYDADVLPIAKMILTEAERTEYGYKGD